MITKLAIRGYKSLRDISLQPVGLNVLVGANSCGKSSVLQTLLLLRQSCTGGMTVSKLQLSGGLFEAGMVRDVLHPEARSGMELEIHSPSCAGKATFSPESAHATDARELVTQTPLQLPPTICDSAIDTFAYLSAERIGPRVVYQLPRPGDLLTGPVGMRGEFTTAFLARCRASNRAPEADWFRLLSRTAEVMPEDLSLDESSERNLARLDLVAKQLLAWLVPGIDFETMEQSFMDSAQLTYVRDPGGTKTAVRPTHMGFGVTYALPILVAALAMRRHGTLLLENPEAHLHPLSQSRAGIFLALAASQNTQIFAETHSDHIVNGIRLAAKYGLIDSREVKFFYFRKRPSDDSTIVTEVGISQDGRLSSWPDGFFDQIERDLSRL